MKTKTIILITAATLASAMPSPGANAAANDESPQRDRETAQFQGTPRLGELRRADHIIGSDIQDEQGNRLGSIKDLALDLENGRVTEVIVARGGTLGMEAKLGVLPPESFIWDSEMKIFRLNMTKAKLDNAPEFPISHWAECTTDAPVKEVYQRYGVEPYFKNDMDQSASALAPVPQSGQDTRYYHFNGENAMPHLGHVASASSLMGAATYNMQNEKLAHVNDFIVNLPAGRLVEVILGEGGFLGIDRVYSAVPPQSFHWNADGTALTLDTTREDLKSAPHFKSSEWDYAADPERIQQVYSLYHVQPYFLLPETDQGAQNVRERTDNTASQLSQGNNTDLDITRQIHNSVDANDQVSADSKKVQIVTSDGKVTLAGTVKSEDEKRMIGEAAAKIAGAGKVDNLLQVRNGSENPLPTSGVPNIPQ